VCTDTLQTLHTQACVYMKLFSTVSRYCYNKMSIEVPRDQLTLEQKELIRKLLTIQPRAAPSYNKSAAFYAASEPKEPIIFFETEGPLVRIPFAIGARILGAFVNNRRVNPQLPFVFTGKLRPEQEEVVEEALKLMRTTGTVTLGTYPGSGKTVMGAWLSSKIWPEPNKAEPVLVIHPLTVLNESWANTFTEFTDATVWVVDGKSPPAIMPNVIISHDRRVEKIPPAWLKSIGFLILDEAHKLCTPTKVHALLATQPKYILAETATLHRPDDGLHAMIYAMVGTHSIDRISTKPFSVTKLLTGIKVPLETTTKGVNFQALMTSLAQEPQRNKIVVDIVMANLAQGWKIIILTPTKEHVNILNRLLQEQGVRTDFMMGTKSKYHDSDVLLGTVSKIGTGFDEKMSCPDFGGKRADLLIYLASTKKAGMMEQNVGRVFRADQPAVIHFVDDNPISKRHWSEVQKWYKSRNGTISEIRL